MGRFWLAILGVILVAVGGYGACRVQTAGGVKVDDIRIPLASGEELSALLYTPPNATEDMPAPGVLAVHGYINSRETQSPFAIELARRGYVVLALDQSGHGFSTNTAFADGFGGPAGLAYLRALPNVDTARIGLEGHSMGGWTVLAAAATMPEAYQSVALVGSSTGAPYAAPGTPEWPRNLAVIFSTYDEFGPLMWGVEKAADVAGSQKLQALFGADAPVVPEQLYGDIAAGTARYLTQPVTTHPGDHFSPAAVADVIEWMDRTIGQPLPLAADDQIWMAKEGFTLLALVGTVLLVLGVFGAITGPPSVNPLGEAASTGSATCWLTLAVAIIAPALTYFPATALGEGLTGLTIFKQNVTTQIMTWAFVNGIIAAIGVVLARRFEIRVEPRAIIGAIAAVSVAYLAVYLTCLLFTADMRFWVLALKPMAAHHWPIFFAYLLPFGFFFYASYAALGGLILRRVDRASLQYLYAWLASAGGMTALVGIAYAGLFANGKLPAGFDPLFSIVGMQFVPVLTVTGIIGAYTWRRSGSAVPGAILSALLVTWYIVAGQATHG